MILKCICGLIVSSVLFTATLVAQDHDAHQPAERKPLNTIMVDLGAAMNHLNEAIFKEDYTAVAKAAAEISAHPQVMPDEMAKIAKALGKDMATFKQWDHKAHMAAVEAEKAAAALKQSDVLKAHGKIMNACVSCHTQFRTKVKNALAAK